MSRDKNYTAEELLDMAYQTQEMRHNKFRYDSSLGRLLKAYIDAGLLYDSECIQVDIDVMIEELIEMVGTIQELKQTDK